MYIFSILLVLGLVPDVRNSKGEMRELLVKINICLYLGLDTLIHLFIFYSPSPSDDLILKE